MPIFIEFIKKINLDNNFIFHIPSINNRKQLINDLLAVSGIKNYLITTSEEDKNLYIKYSILAVSKSGTITLDICKNQCPLIVVYKTFAVNYLLIKPFIKTKFGNILNIIANREVIPELIQNDCNVNNIYKKAQEFINNKNLRNSQVIDYTRFLKEIIISNSLEKISDCVLE